MQGRLARLQIRNYEFVPHESLRVHYTAEVGTLRYDLTAQIGHPVPDSKGIEKLTASARDRRVARLPVARLADLKAQISWYPIDFGLPLLALSDVELADTVGIDSAGPTSQFAWTPGRAAVVRFPKALVRVYHDPADAQRSASALRLIDGHLPIARLLSSNIEEGLIAQELKPGRPMLREKAFADAPLAARFIEKLHNTETGAIDPESTLPSRSPMRLLDDAEKSVAFVEYCRPDLAPRLRAKLAQLRSNAPADLASVPSHGDFNFGNLHRNGDELHVIDADELCLAPRALDLATFAVSLMLGREEDFADLHAVATTLQESYGTKIESFEWYMAAEMLRMIDGPLRCMSRDWSERTDSWLSTTERCCAA